MIDRLYYSLPILLALASGILTSMAGWPAYALCVLTAFWAGFIQRTIYNERR